MIVRLETREVTQRLADGVEYTFWTFGGTVPGSFMRAIGVVLNGLSGPIRVKAVRSAGGTKAKADAH